MSSTGFKPSQSQPRHWNLNHANNSVSHVAFQHSATLEDDNVSMTYAGDAGPVHAADDECDRGEEEQEQQDEEQADELNEHYSGAPFDYHASHVAYDASHHQIPYSAHAVHTNGTYLVHEDESDVSDNGGGPFAPVDYLSIANILTSDIDMEEAFELAGDFAPFNDHGTDYHHYTSQGEVDGILFGVDPAASHWEIPGEISPPHAASIASDDPEEVQEQLDQLGPGDEFEDGSTVWFPVPPPPASVSPNMSNLSPGNYPLADFLQQWSFMGTRKSREQRQCPWPQKVIDFSQTHLTHVQYADLAVDQCDIQGIDWQDLKVTRKDARERRLNTYRNYTNKEGSDHHWDVSSGRRVLGGMHHHDDTDSGLVDCTRFQTYGEFL